MEVTGEDYSIKGYVIVIVGSMKNNCSIIKIANDLMLSNMFRVALKSEDYKTCASIKTEINNRIDADKIDSELFKRTNLKGLNGLFDNYKPIER